MQKTALLLAAAATFTACSSDLEINAPYQDNSVVYSLLNMRDSIHYVKLNRAFLGEGNAFDYAQIPDSNEYAEGDVTFAMVYRLNNGVRVDSFPLRDTLLTEREPGVFFYPEHRLMYFTHPVTLLPVTQVPVYLFQDSEYQVVIEVKGRRITGTAAIVNDFAINAADQSLTNEINLVGGSTGFGTWSLDWRTGLDGKRYEVTYSLNYREVRGTDTLDKAFTQKLGTVVAANSQQAGAEMALILDGELFFGSLANAVPTDPSVDQRIMTGMDFNFTVANDEFHTYLSLSEPVTGIVEERPGYTNLENAIGIFGSRFTKSVLGKRFNDATLNYIINSEQLGPKRFCAAYRVGPPYGCN